MFKVYVDGQHGTTGLLVNERLEKHPEVEILTIPFEERHNKDKRIELLNEADVVFLCLPDDAAKESVTFITNPNTKIIDASTAHRINPDWAYGFAEMSDEHRSKIINSKRVANPGCHATASIAALYPLVEQGVLAEDSLVKIFSITGYSGGGKQMIKTYEETQDPAYNAPMQYALGLTHKHVPEIKVHSGLNSNPLFMPIVSNYERGLAITLPLFNEELQLEMTKEQLVKIYKKFYGDSYFVVVHEADDTSGLVENRIDVQANNNTNFMDVFVYGNEDQFQIIVRIDNLGKGASGAAIQNMNIMMGIDETTGLV